MSIDIYVIVTTLLLTVAEASIPFVPGNLIPYLAKIPRFPARTLEQAKVKATIWPVVYEAQNHRELREESQRWTEETVQWFRDAINVIDTEAKRVHALGEVRDLLLFSVLINNEDFFTLAAHCILYTIGGVFTFIHCI